MGFGFLLFVVSVSVMMLVVAMIVFAAEMLWIRTPQSPAARLVPEAARGAYILVPRNLPEAAERP
jgi:hypothetical protein